MSSKIIGRMRCPCCGFEKAHVKKKDEEGKRAFFYCPNQDPPCHVQIYARNEVQEKWLLESMTPVEGQPKREPEAEPTTPATPPNETKPEATPKRAGLGAYLL